MAVKEYDPTCLSQHYVELRNKYLKHSPAGVEVEYIEINLSIHGIVLAQMGFNLIHFVRHVYIRRGKYSL